MAVTTKKILLFLTGGVAAAALVAYAAGAFDPLLRRSPSTIASLPDPENAGGSETGAPAPAVGPAEEPSRDPADATASGTAAPESDVGGPADAGPETIAADGTAGEEKPKDPAAEVVPPSFDVVRVESDGSIVIAGKAAAGADVNLLVGSNVIGTARAGPEGDFAVVLDESLKPGDYQIVLRSTAPDNIVAMSVETAVVSIPTQPDGQVLALVEEPGKPSQMITLPEPQKPASNAKPPEAEAPAATEVPAPDVPMSEAAGPANDDDMETGQTSPAPEAASKSSDAPEPAPPAKSAAPGPVVRVEAVEIDGRRIFVAGVADPERSVRGYANEILLGDAKAAPDGRFLIEAERDLPVGDYIIRVDALEADGVKVAARAAVPFEREPGETIAAVAASPEPASPAVMAPAESGTAAGAAESRGMTERPFPAEQEPDVSVDAVSPAKRAGEQEPVGKSPEIAAQTPDAGPPSSPGSDQQDVAGAFEESGQPGPQEPASISAGSSPVAEVPAAETPVSKTEVAGTPPARLPGASDTVDTEAGARAPAAEQLSAGADSEAAPPAAPPASGTGNEIAAASPEGSNELPAPPPAEGVAEVLSPKLQPVGSAVIIRRGDTLWRISRRVYGKGVRYSTIYLANQNQIEDPDRIWPGQVFKVPEVSNDGKVEADYSRLGNRLTTIPVEGEEPEAKDDE